MPRVYVNRKREKVLASIKRHGFIFDPLWIEILCDAGLVLYKHKGYAVIRPKIEGTKRGRHKVRVSRLITLCPSELIVDHINRHREDNRARNLRVVTWNENHANRGPYKVYRY
jgi:hypothetical protein